jgi:hypothetical protein
VLDFIQYRVDGDLPVEAYPDETTAISATLVIEMMTADYSPEAKRARIVPASTSARYV